MFELFSELPIFLQRIIQLLSVFSAFGTYVGVVTAVIGEWKRNQQLKREIKREENQIKGHWNRVQ